jgi:hypothetical protein
MNWYRYLGIGIGGSEKHETSALILNQLAKYMLGHGISTRRWSNEQRHAAHQLNTCYIPDSYIFYLVLLSFRSESPPIYSIHFQHSKGCTRLHFDIYFLIHPYGTWLAVLAHFTRTAKWLLTWMRSSCNNSTCQTVQYGYNWEPRCSATASSF